MFLKKIKLYLKSTGYFQGMMPTPAFRLGAICNQTPRTLRPLGRYIAGLPFIIRAKALGEMYCQANTPILKDGVGCLNRIETLNIPSKTFNQFVNINNTQLRRVPKKHLQNLNEKIKKQ